MYASLICKAAALGGALLALPLAAVFTLQGPLPAAEPATMVPAPALDEPPTSAPSETAVLAGGCFWGMQGVFEHVRGVLRVVSGYAGGADDAVTYDVVSTGTTGNAESVQITYDPRQITYGGLLQIYFSVAHDPTQVNRQGPDWGTQYRSAIFPRDATQQNIAAAYVAQLERAHAFGAPIATRIETGAHFHPAEDWHQDYLAHNPSDAYIVINDLPKIANLRRLFPQRYRDQPVLVARAKP
ncbi:MAG: peptide-methionine (S)-S-oxide reductase MsrA [Rhodanobacteraceae bacterium]|jgi:peptide-methionine (S)-S-oxide reductase|nr:peptide-methionine (S)-S-oxide reductase MsrA [Rhodanobacteraceae bacterium]